MGHGRAAAGAAERLERMVGYSCAILARTRPIHAVIRGAADKEAFAAALGHRLFHDRLAEQTERVRRYLAEDLRAGLSVDEAGQRYCVLASPELYHLLTAELGWTPEEHRTWLTELLDGSCSDSSVRDGRRRREPATARGPSNVALIGGVGRTWHARSS